jgi:hypothetical protein
VRVAALYVAKGGIYFGRDDVDPWDEARDARLYAGPHPVVCHSPCTTWSPLAFIWQARRGTPVGEDGQCFAHALASVRRWGGVLEHPAGSAALARLRSNPTTGLRRVGRCRGLHRVDLSRRAGALRPHRPESDLALRGARLLAVAPVGAFRGHGAN